MITRKNEYRSTVSRIAHRLINDGRVSNDFSLLVAINPVTNLPFSDVDLVNSPDTPDGIRKALLSSGSLDAHPYAVGLDEEQQVITLRPKNCQSLAETQRFANFLKSYIDTNSSLDSDKSDSDKSDSDISDS